MKGVSGNFISWPYNLTNFFTNTIIIFVLIPIVRIFFDKLIIPRSNLNHEIQNDQNLGAAFLEVTMMIGFSAVLFFTMS